ncbi:MAG TPA: T9SS type A sorting domain-containing protein [Aequorivita sp.]|nr:T9SS type A sorting domain-containing protein [Aequorivita sp.]
MKKNTINLSFVLLALLFGITPIRAQYNQEAKIVSDNREEAAEFGTAVAILDSYAVVGAPRENIASGSVYIYHKDANGDWSFVQSVSAHDPNNGAEFGGGVKITDSHLVIAAGRANVSGTERTGALYVYELNGSTWEYDTKLIAGDYSFGAMMGMNPTSLALNNSTIVAGAPGENGWTGSAYIFEKSEGTWTEVQKLLSPDPQNGSSFGIGVAIDGNYLIVGAGEEDGTKGAAHIFQKNSSGEWQHVQKITASDAMNQAYFGTSVAISENRLAVGAYHHADGTGAVYIFEDDGTGNWVETQKITASSPSSEANFGWNCILRDDLLVVSAPHPYGLEKGEVYVYKNIDGGFVEVQLVESLDLEPEDFYGWNIEMDTDQLIVGAPWEDEDPTGGNPVDRAGSAYIFRDLTLSTNEFQINTSVEVYPVPTQDILTITSSYNFNKIKLISQLGSVLFQSNLKETQEHSLNLSQYAKGFYFLHIGAVNGQTTVKKILIK